MSETELLFVVPSCDDVNHVVVFLTGSQPLPEGVVAGIYLHWPKPTPGWFLLGHINNEKPSAIYKIAKVSHLYVIYVRGKKEKLKTNSMSHRKTVSANVLCHA